MKGSKRLRTKGRGKDLAEAVVNLADLQTGVEIERGVGIAHGQVVGHQRMMVEAGQVQGPMVGDRVLDHSLMMARVGQGKDLEMDRIRSQLYNVQSKTTHLLPAMIAPSTRAQTRGIPVAETDNLIKTPFEAQNNL